MPGQVPTSLYIISPEKFVLSEFAGQVREALADQKVAVFQLRMKGASDSEVIDACHKLVPICHEYNTQFILNDYVHLVTQVGASGAHIGADDMSLEEARSILGKNKIIGVSCYADGDRAMDVAAAGADYVAFGAFYHTDTKKPRGHPDPKLLKWWSATSTVPCVAIGGIKPHNCAPLVKAGADFIAVVTAIWDDKDGPKAAVEKMHKAIHGAL